MFKTRRSRLQAIFSWTTIFTLICNIFTIPVHAQEHDSPEDVEVYFVAFENSVQTKDNLDTWIQKTEQKLKEQYKTEQIYYNVSEEELEDGTKKVIDLEYHLQKEREEYESKDQANQILAEIKEKNQEKELFSDRENSGKLVLILNDGQDQPFYVQEKVEGVLGKNWNKTVDIFNDSYFEENQGKKLEEKKEELPKKEESSPKLYAEKKESVLKHVRLLKDQVNVYEEGYARVYYSVMEEAKGTIEVYDANGQLIQRLYDNVRHAPENYYMDWNLKDSNGKNVPEGTYTFRLTFDGMLEEIQVKVRAEKKPVLKNVRVAKDQVNVYEESYARVYYSVMEEAKGTIEVYDANGQLIQRLYDNVRHAPENYYMDWNLKDSNGKDVPEGTYTFRLTFGGMSEEIQVKVRAEKKPVLKNVRAAKDQVNVYEEGYARVYYSVMEEAKGTIEVYDANGQLIQRLYDNVRHAPLNYYMDWDLKDSNGKDVPEGTYTFRLTFGGMIEEVNVVVTDFLEITHTKIEPKEIESGQETAAYYMISHNAVGSVAVYNEDGEKVHDIYDHTPHIEGYYKVTWDGTDNNGKAVPSGTYTIRITFGTNEKELEVILKDKMFLKHVRVEQEQFNSQENKPVRIYYSVMHSSIGTIEVYDSNGKLVQNLYDHVRHVPENYYIDWNLKDNSNNKVKEGTYTIRFEFESQGNKDTQEIKVEVIDEVINPIRLSNVHIQQEVVDYSTGKASFFYQVSKDCVGTLGVYDQSGNKIYTIYDEIPHSAGYYRADWNLRNKEGKIVRPGKYTFKLKVEADGIVKTAETSVFVKKSGDILDRRAVKFSYIEWQKLFKGNTQDEFIRNINAVLSNMKRSDLNTVMLQVRSHGDAYYPSEVYPWSENVTGAAGQNPGYDPLQIFVQKAHENGVKVHAWINPYKLMMDDQMNQIPEHYKIKQWYADPAYMARDNKGYWVLNPGNNEVRKLVSDGVSEIIKNYAIDGIYVEDHCYLEGIRPSTFNLSESSARNAATAMVKGIYDTVKAVNTNILFGVGTSGKYSNETPDTDLYEYTNVKKWCKEPGYIDYIIPQIYWSRNDSSVSFEKTLHNWETLVSQANTGLYVGISAEKFAGLTELDEQIKLVTQSQWAEGYLLDRYEHIAAIQGPSLELSVEQPDETSVSAQNVRLYYSVNKKSIGDIKIYDSQNKLIQTIYEGVPHEPMRYAVSWDLCDERGKKVTEGEYKAKFVFRADGVTRTGECNIVVGPEQPLVWIDAGHGGKDVGAVGNGRYERDDNLRIALEVQRVLEQQNVRVAMSRVDEDPSYESQGLKSLGERVEKANAMKADLFISLHRDAIPAPTKANGFTVYTHNASDPGNNNPSANANKNSGCVQISTILEQQISSVGAFRSRGIKYGSASGSKDLYVNKHTNMPSCLLEMGFITDQNDNWIFDTYLKENSKAIAKGIMIYLGLEFNENAYTAY